MQELHGLKDAGFIVMDALNPSDLATYRTDFDAAERAFPEFIPGNPYRYTLGGFGAYGNPGSFHNMFVRTLRMQLYPVAQAVFRDYVCDPTMKMEMLFDRMMKRPAGIQYSGETWHRDVSTTAAPDDVIFGGYVNLDDNDQVFLCSPGDFGERSASGFVKHSAPPKRLQREVAVGPGQLLIFRQDLLHAVKDREYDYDRYRLFTGWRLTSSRVPLFGDDEMDRVFNDFATPRLPSGQKTPLYSSNHRSIHLYSPSPVAGTFLWCQEALKPELLTDRIRTTGDIIAPRYIDSLLAYGWGDYYPDYDESERDAYRPMPIIAPTQDLHKDSDETIKDNEVARAVASPTYGSPSSQSTPLYAPSSPPYLPNSPTYSPSLSPYMPSSPVYNPYIDSSPYLPNSPAYSQTLPEYVPSSPAYNSDIDS